MTEETKTAEEVKDEATNTIVVQAEAKVEPVEVTATIEESNTEDNTTDNNAVSASNETKIEDSKDTESTEEVENSAVITEQNPINLKEVIIDINKELNLNLEGIEEKFNNPVNKSYIAFYGNNIISLNYHYKHSKAKDFYKDQLITKLKNFLSILS